MTETPPIAVITGASSGVGAATASALAKAGYTVLLGARREQRIQALAEELGGQSHVLDVTDPASVDAFAAASPRRIDLLVNNAGTALGIDPVEASDDSDWQRMWETNVLGVVRMTRSLLPALRRSSNPRLMIIGSTSGFETYRGGGGYTSTKHALRAVVRTLRLELLGEPVRVTEITPGMIETEFSVQRFGGDQERADAIYRGMTPLTGRDVAECVLFAASRPAHVNIDEIVVRPRDQATFNEVHREPAS